MIVCNTIVKHVVKHLKKFCDNLLELLSYIDPK